MNEYLKKHTLIESHIRVSKDITNSVVGLKADIFEITAATRNPQQRVVANRKVTNDVEFIKDLASTLNVGEEEIKPIYLHLNKVQESIVHLMRLLDLRDDSLKKRQTPILPVVREIREFNLTIPARIGHLLEHVGKVQAYLDKKNDYFENEIERARIKFLYIEIAISLIIIILTLYLAGFISRQIIKLYHKIEVQLYVDDLTGLNSRRALQKDFVGVDKFTLIIFDIDSFKTINELYGPIVGNEVLTNLALLFQTYFGNTGFKLFRISGDEFVLFEQGREYKYREVEVVI
ncbi:MAG: diguanylate cyclase, partial [Gammaproteobacteria bacterium]|nr:diguanylate cyclase [Gammaproteobacteria bacterium]